ncbi:MAG: T9SS type A sorting domain-containing protein [Calditrichaceae bacterium]|nr:T9SS type A sorting domain-containing protein [Calditrichaceae bacterium]
MEARYKKIRYVIYFVFGLINLGFGGSIFQIHEDPSAGKVNEVRSMSYDFSNVIGVGDNDRFYKIINNATTMQWKNLGFSANYKGIDYYITGTDTVMVIPTLDCSVLEWNSILDTIGEVNWQKKQLSAGLYHDYKQVHYYSGYFYAGGESDTLHYSVPSSPFWLITDLNNHGADVVDILHGNNNLYMVATKDNNTLIYALDDYSVQDFHVEHTLENFIASSAGFIQDESSNDELYVLGTDLSDGFSAVMKFPNEGSRLESPGKILSTGVAGSEFMDIDGFTTYLKHKIWATTNTGEVWESSDYGLTWKIVYNDLLNRPLGPILINQGEKINEDPVRIFGAEGIILKSGFEIQYTLPYNNEQLNTMLDHITIKFTSIPDIVSLSKNIMINSSISGNQMFSIAVDNMDSTLITINFEKISGKGTIPGERFFVGISDSLRDKSGDYISSEKEYNFSFDIMPFAQSDFEFDPQSELESLGVPTTNPVTGLFNEDDTFDILFYARDTLYIVTEDPDDGQFRIMERYFLPGQEIVVDTSLQTQLSITDINRDGLPDLILNDTKSIGMVINQSTAQDFAFSEIILIKSTQKIKKVIPSYLNSNNLVDLLVVNDTVYTQLDLTESGFEGYINQIIPYQSYAFDATIGDINHDGALDLVITNYTSGSINVLRGDNKGDFNEVTVTDQTYYFKILLADLDNDPAVPDLEIIGVGLNQIDIYKMSGSENGNWTFDKAMVYTDNVLPISDVLIHDFGTNSDAYAMDMLVLTRDSVHILENNTTSPGNFQFDKSTGNSIGIDYDIYDGIVYGDYNKDANLDFTLFDRHKGALETYYKAGWQTEITQILPHKYTVYLEWTSLPEEEGELEYYRIAKDSLPNNYNHFNWKVTTNNFITDTLTDRYPISWYSIQAVYNGGRLSSWSDPVSVQNYIELNGDQSGALVDSSRLYVARSGLIVREGYSLLIGPGIDIAFETETSFEVFGGLTIAGSDIDREMVQLHSVHHDDTSWRGIKINSGIDTVNMRWFSVSDADTGVIVNGRPVRMSLGGLGNNKVGLVFSGDSLALQNIVVDSNLTGIILGDGARAAFRNINVTGNAIEGIHVNATSRVKIKNSILWGNGEVALSKQTGSGQVDLSFSTIDNMVGSINQFAISNRPPIFMPADSGHYRMDYLSPTIDMGDPADDFSHEPAPNGGRINQGLFGGTRFATISRAARLGLFPDKIIAQVRPPQADTISIFVKNAGGSVLNISNIGFTNNLPVFSIISQSHFEVPVNDSSVIRLRFAPPERNAYQDTLIITTNDNRYADGIISVPLEGIGLNSPPEIMQIPPRFILVEALYSHQITVFDADGDSLTYNPVTMPGWLTLDETHTLIGTPALSDTGLNRVVVIITDGFGGNTTLDYFIRVRTQSTELEIPQVEIYGPKSYTVQQAMVFMRYEVFPGISGKLETLRIRYYLQKVVSAAQPVIYDTSLVYALKFYPLDDGLYLFKVWAYDEEGNGYEGRGADSVLINVQASEKKIRRFRWYMSSFPRPQHINWYDFEYSDSAAIFFVWDNKMNDYRPINRSQIAMGSGFWVLSPDTIKFNLNSLQQLSRNDDRLLTKNIVKGWNQIGIPVGYAVNWKNMRFIDSTNVSESLLDAVSDGKIQGAVHWFLQAGSSQGYQMVELDSNAIALPWVGYWLKSNHNGQIQFTTEPFEVASVAPVHDIVNKTNHTSSIQPDEWRISINLTNKKYEDNNNIFGISSKDYGIISDPPPFGEYCTLSFTDEKTSISRKIQCPFEDIKEVKTWDMEVESQTVSDKHLLKWSTKSLESGFLNIFLVDLQQENVINMMEVTEYSFIPKSTKYRFRIYASQDMEFSPKIIPLSFKLEQNYPNPFNPSTTIKFGIPESSANAKVQLRIYDILGREVITLINGTYEPGYHTVIWNGINKNREQVSTGIYFYQLITNKNSIVKKMVLVK